ncbi:MAG: phage major capsid protein, partial [Burkholderiaceae bacterium]
YSGAESANGGFVTLKYKSADVLFDGNSGITASRMYMLNTEYLYLCVHRDADMEQMDAKYPINQDAEVIPILWMGNLVCSNRKQQGVIKP